MACFAGGKAVRKRKEKGVPVQQQHGGNHPAARERVLFFSRVAALFWLESPRRMSFWVVCYILSLQSHGNKARQASRKAGKQGRGGVYFLGHSERGKMAFPLPFPRLTRLWDNHVPKLVSWSSKGRQALVLHFPFF